jgi:hypothetical protein
VAPCLTHLEPTACFRIEHPPTSSHLPLDPASHATSSSSLTSFLPGSSIVTPSEILSYHCQQPLAIVYRILPNYSFISLEATAEDREKLKQVQRREHCSPRLPISRLEHGRLRRTAQPLIHREDLRQARGPSTRFRSSATPPVSLLSECSTRRNTSRNSYRRQSRHCGSINRPMTDRGFCMAGEDKQHRKNRDMCRAR